jgi:hypothetical protein
MGHQRTVCKGFSVYRQGKKHMRFRKRDAKLKPVTISKGYKTKSFEPPTIQHAYQPAPLLFQQPAAWCRLPPVPAIQPETF